MSDAPKPTALLFVDGTNLDQVLHDLTEVVRERGLPILERFRDAEEVVKMASKGQLHSAAGSPVSERVVQAALAKLGRR